MHQQRLNKTIDSLCFMISQYLILSSIFHSRTTTNGRSQRFNVDVEKSRCSHLGFFGIVFRNCFASSMGLRMGALLSMEWVKNDG